MLSQKQELNYLKSLFFLFGFLIMAWAPRLSEVKANLRLSNGEFGSLISTAAIGSFISLMTVGHLVHKYGAKLILQLSAIGLAISLLTLVHTSSTFIFLIASITWGSAISGFHISINSQGFSFQDRWHKNVITLLSGAWSFGALVTSIIAGLLIGNISLTTHITILTVATLAGMLYAISSMTQTLVKANQNPEKEYGFSDLFKGFEIQAVVSAGLISSLMLEYAVGDWASIFLSEDMGLKSGINTLPYILFTVAMIVGRLNVHRLLEKNSIIKLSKIASIASGLSFLGTIFIADVIKEESQLTLIVVLCIGFTIAGLGSSFLAPTFMNAANTRSKHPSAVVVGQIGVTNIILAFVLRWVIAWTAELTSLSIGLAIPALMLLTVPLFTKVLKKD
jgi:MFS family permease